MSIEKWGVRFQDTNAVSVLRRVGESCIDLANKMQEEDPDAEILSLHLETIELGIESPLSEETEPWQRLKIMLSRTNNKE